MNLETKERMAGVARNTRDVRQLRAIEKIASELELLRLNFDAWLYKMYQEKAEDIMATIAEIAIVPPEVEIREKKD